MRLDWRRTTVYATIMGMEGSWLYALMALLNRAAADSRLSVLGLLLSYFLSFGFSKALQRLGWPKFFLTSISWLLWVPVMLLTIKIQLFGDIALSDPAWLRALPQALSEILYTFQPELLILVSSGVLWWLGRRLAYLSIEFSTAVSEFQFGLVGLLLAFFITSQLGLDLSSSVPTAMVFFSFALLGVSIAHAQGTGWLSGWYQGHWSGLLLISISLVLIMGLVIGMIVTPDLLQLIVRGLKWLWGLVVKVLEFLASLLPQPEPGQPLPTMPAVPGGEPEEPLRFFEIPESVRNGLRLGWSVLVIGLVLLTLWRVSSQIFGWLRRRMASSGGEVESLSGAFKADLIGWLKRILFKLLGLRARLQPKRKPGFILPEVASVRQIYSQLLRWAAAGGYPRRLSDTPHEYLYVLENLLPETQADLAFITRQYVSARYGSSLPTEEELRQLRQRWHKVRRNRLEKPEAEPRTGGEG